MIDPKDTLRICGDATPGPWHTAMAAYDSDDPEYFELSAVESTETGDLVIEYCNQDDADLIAHAREALPEYAAWVNDVCQNLQGILCERDDGAPTERNLKLAELLARVKCE